MTDNQSNSSGSEKQSLSDSEVIVNTSRRRLTGAGLGMSAIFTLASRPVLAAQQCTSPSAAASSNLSQHGTPTVCSGRTPGFWKNPQKASEWPLPYSQGTCANGSNGNGNSGTSQGCSSSPANWSGGTLFHPLFGGSKFKTLSLTQVMALNDNDYSDIKDQDNLGAHIAAALLNAAKGFTKGVLDENAVIGMWNEWAVNSHFEPTAGVKWDSAQIVMYLQSTMPEKSED